MTPVRLEPAYKERIQVITGHADPYDKTGDATKGSRGERCDFIKTFSNELFSRVRVL